MTRRQRRGMSIDADLYERLAAAADERAISARKLAEMAINHFLDRLIPVDELLSPRERSTDTGSEQ